MGNHSGKQKDKSIAMKTWCGKKTYLSNVRRNSHLSDSDRREFSPHIGYPHLWRDPGTQTPTHTHTPFAETPDYKVIPNRNVRCTAAP